MKTLLIFYEEAEVDLCKNPKKKIFGYADVTPLDHSPGLQLDRPPISFLKTAVFT